MPFHKAQVDLAILNIHNRLCAPAAISLDTVKLSLLFFVQRIKYIKQKDTYTTWIFCWSKHAGLCAIADRLLIVNRVVNALRYNQGKTIQQPGASRPSDTSSDNVKMSSAKDHAQLIIHLKILVRE